MTASDRREPKPLDIPKELAEFDWAIAIIEKWFRRGLDELLKPDFLKSRFQKSKTRFDPIYSSLVGGMGDEPLQQTFHSFWQLGQTLATQSRFWLEDSIYELVFRQVIRRHLEKQSLPPSRSIPPALWRGDPSDWPIVCSKGLLSHGVLSKRKSIASLGEHVLEECHGRGAWRVPINRAVLDTVDQLIGRHERELPPSPLPFHSRSRTPAQHEQATEHDKNNFSIISESFDNSGNADEIAVHANLIIADPDKSGGTPSVTALRFVNPRALMNHRSRRDERANLLRLYAYLVQERIFEEPPLIRVAVAEVVPREHIVSPVRIVGHDSGAFSYDKYPDFFSSDTYWPWYRFWSFIGVPFDVVELAIARVGSALGERLRDGLVDLLPELPKSAQRHQDPHSPAAIRPIRVKSGPVRTEGRLCRLVELEDGTSRVESWGGGEWVPSPEINSADVLSRGPASLESLRRFGVPDDGQNV